jgi:hypothetical protein
MRKHKSDKEILSIPCKVVSTIINNYPSASINLYNIPILKEYDTYRSEQKTAAKTQHYGIAWTNKMVYAAGPNTPKVFHFFNKHHYGDNILNLKFFYNIAEILKQNNIIIKYYYSPEYITRREELDRYIHANNTVSLHPLHEKPGHAHELWMGNPIQIENVHHTIMDKYFNLYYINIMKILGLEHVKINTSLYQDEPYLQEIYNKLDPKFQNVDILIINAEPKSNQLIYNKDKFNKMCIRLSKNYKVVTTNCVIPEIVCTMDAKLMLQDIGAISTHAKYIIGTHSGPVTACFNSTTHANVKKWILFADNNTTHESDKIVVVKSKYDTDTIEKNIN